MHDIPLLHSGQSPTMQGIVLYNELHVQIDLLSVLTLVNTDFRPRIYTTGTNLVPTLPVGTWSQSEKDEPFQYLNSPCSS